MRLSRLLPVFLVLLQSGLAVGHAHTHPGRPAHTQSPHLHACELLELFHSSPDDHEHDGPDHDADAVDLADALACAAPPAPDTFTTDLAPVEPSVVAEVPIARAHPGGLPPSTAGPPHPLYLTYCILTI